MIKSITSVFDGEVKEQATSYIDLLFCLAKKGGSTVDERMLKVFEITESYFSVVGKHMDGRQLDRLSSLILYDDHHDKSTNKVKATEYPSLNWRQLKRRSENDVSFIWTDSIDCMGVDHRVPTRDDNRNRREKLGLI